MFELIVNFACYIQSVSYPLFFPEFIASLYLLRKTEGTFAGTVIMHKEKYVNTNFKKIDGKTAQICSYIF